TFRRRPCGHSCCIDAGIPRNSSPPSLAVFGIRSRLRTFDGADKGSQRERDSPDRSPWNCEEGETRRAGNGFPSTPGSPARSLCAPGPRICEPNLLPEEHVFNTSVWRTENGSPAGDGVVGKGGVRVGRPPL